MTLKSKKIFIPALIVSCLIAGALGIKFYSAFAVEAQENELIDVEVCREALVTKYEEELSKFMAFLDENFKNESSTSSLTNIAIARYREYKEYLQKEFKKLQIGGIQGAAQGDIRLYDDAVRNYSLCEEIKNTYVSLGRQRLMDKIHTSANQKKASVLLEKYKAINGRLMNLNMAISDMYANYKTFKEKFPGFTCKDCMKSLL